MQLQAQLLALLTAPTSTCLSPALLDPAKFDSKAYHFDTWLPAIKAKLQVDKPRSAIQLHNFTMFTIDSSLQYSQLSSLS